VADQDQGHKFVELVLTCSSWQEAQNIADALLDKRLVGCVHFIEIKSKYWWHGELDQAKEIKLFMQTFGHLFDEIETEVSKLHSYKSFVLQSLPLDRLSKNAQTWLTQEVNN
jgi:periplasmic divalent cation tolerance protein